MTWKELFPQAMKTAYLDSAAEGLPAPGCADAVQLYFQHKDLGTPGRKLFAETENQALESAAALLGTHKNDVTFVSNASEALYILAGSLDWKPGDEVVISDLEFPSNIFPWLRLREKGVRVVVVRENGGALQWQAAADCISSRTRLLSLSLVSYKTGGYLTGIPQLAAEAKRVGAFVSIDGTQALGRCPVSLEGVDYFMASSFKWLMGPHGLGIVYLSPAFREALNPPSLGWHSVTDAFAADRFERYHLKKGAGCLAAGMPNFPSIYALRESLRFVLEAKVEVIYEKLRPLVEKLRSGFELLGCDMLTPKTSEIASGIVAFRHAQAEAIGAILAQNGVIVWGGDRRVRASIHLYNDMSDIDRCLDAMAVALRQLGRNASESAT